MPREGGLIGRFLHAVFSFLVGTALCLTPVTSLVVLGWLMRRMRMVALRRAGMAGARPGWILGGPDASGLGRILGGLAANIRDGVMAAVALAVATAPFSVIWLLSWWAGWENSFSKGYEQAFVGPALGLFGVAVFSSVMIWLPMALAHQAVENRAFALFEFRFGAKCSPPFRLGLSEGLPWRRSSRVCRSLRVAGSWSLPVASCPGSMT